MSEIPAGRRPLNGTVSQRYSAMLRGLFLAVVALCLAWQVAYDSHVTTAIALFPQWLLLGCLWHSLRPTPIDARFDVRGTVILAVLVPAMSCLALLMAWSGWKANTLAICGVVPVSDSASYFISGQTFLREGFLDVAGQRRPLNTLLNSIWQYFSADGFKMSLLIQALVFSAAAFLSSALVGALRGFRAGMLFFAFLLVFAEPYLPTMMSENNGIIFGTLAFAAFLYGLHRGSFFAYCLGALLLATGFAIRPSALFVLPCVVMSGALNFGRGPVRRLAVATVLAVAVLIPSAASVLLNKSLGHGEGALNANLSYTVYGLVAGGKGWEQFQRDNPRALAGLSEAEQSRRIWTASREHFSAHPLDLVRGLVLGQAAGPLQTFAQIVRLAFFGAAGDPLRIVPSAAIVVVSLLFAGFLFWRGGLLRRFRGARREFRLFGALFLAGYLLSLPFFYRDGGLRLQAAVIPTLCYFIVLIISPPSAMSAASMSAGSSSRLFAAAAAVAFSLLGLSAWVSMAHPRSRHFDPIPAAESSEENRVIFWFKPGWPQCDLRRFGIVPGDARPRWFSGAIPDDDYRSAGIKEISGRGNLYFGLDIGIRDWKIIHSDQPIGLLNVVEIPSPHADGKKGDAYRDYFPARSVRVVAGGLAGGLAP